MRTRRITAAAGFLLATLLVIVLVAAPAAADAPTVTANKTYGGSDYDVATEVIGTSDGNYLLVGTQRVPNETADAWAAKVDPSGEIIWERNFSTPGLGLFNSAVESPGGNVTLVGYKNTTGTADADSWAVKITSNGDQLWSKTYGTAGVEDRFNDIDRTPDGDFIVVGATKDIQGNNEAQVLKLTVDGRERWNFVYGGRDDDQFFDIERIGPDRYALGGQSESGRNHYDGYLVVIDGSGQARWSRFVGHNILDDWIDGITASRDGSFAIAGSHSASYNSTLRAYEFQKTFIAKYTLNGTRAWLETAEDRDRNRLNSVALHPDGGYVATGWATSGGPTDGLVMSRYGNGTLRYREYVTTSGGDLFFDVTTNNSNDVTTVGRVIQSGNTDAWYVALEKNHSSSPPSGSANLSASRQLGAATVAPASQTTVTVTIQLNQSVSRLSITESFAPALGAASVSQIQINGQSTIPTSATFVNDTGVVVLQNLNAGDTITVTYTATLPADASDGQNFEITGTVTTPSETVSIQADTLTAGGGISRYAGQDNRVSTSELRQAISDWVGGQIETSTLRSVITAWVKQSTI